MDTYTIGQKVSFSIEGLPYPATVIALLSPNRERPEGAYRLRIDGVDGYTPEVVPSRLQPA